MTELLTIEDIAQLWHCSTRHARDVLVKTPGFPSPAPGSGPKLRVWRLRDVRDFIAGRTRQNPANEPESRASA